MAHQTTRTLENTAFEIQQELEALNASVDHDETYGLLVEVRGYGRIDISNVYESVTILKPEETLQALKALAPIDWGGDPGQIDKGFEGVWYAVYQPRLVLKREATSVQYRTETGVQGE